MNREKHWKYALKSGWVLIPVALALLFIYFGKYPYGFATGVMGVFLFFKVAEDGPL